MDIAQQTALVTGANRGFGRLLAAELRSTRRDRLRRRAQTPRRSTTTA